MEDIYYIAHTGFSDNKPHWGLKSPYEGGFLTGKRYTKLIYEGNLEGAKSFLMEKFNLEWEINED